MVFKKEVLIDYSGCMRVVVEVEEKEDNYGAEVKAREIFSNMTNEEFLSNIVLEEYDSEVKDLE